MTTAPTARQRRLGRDGRHLRLRTRRALVGRLLEFSRVAPDTFYDARAQSHAAMLDKDLAMVLEGDVPLYGGVDTVKSSHGLFASAQERSSRSSRSLVPLLAGRFNTWQPGALPGDRPTQQQVGHGTTLSQISAVELVLAVKLVVLVRLPTKKIDAAGRRRCRRSGGR